MYVCIHFYLFRICSVKMEEKLTLSKFLCIVIGLSSIEIFMPRCIMKKYCNITVFIWLTYSLNSLNVMLLVFL